MGKSVAVSPNSGLMLPMVARSARARPARPSPANSTQAPTTPWRRSTSDKGKCTAIYTCLVAGGDMEEPIADEVRGILDGHFILNRAIGERNQWPAMDVLASLSRVMSGIVSKDHKKAAGKLRETLSTYEKQRDLILLGAYQYGTDPRTDGR